MFWDIGIGIVLGIAFNYFPDIPLALSVGWGIVFSLLPDIDMLGFVSVRAKKIFGNHREFSHYPLLYVFPIIIFWLVLGGEWALFLGMAVLLHLLHDTYLIGMGIKWAWPYSQKSYLFFSQDHKHIHRHQHWIRTYYLRPTLVPVPEYMLFIISLVALYFYIF